MWKLDLQNRLDFMKELEPWLDDPNIENGRKKGYWKTNWTLNLLDQMILEIYFAITEDC